MTLSIAMVSDFFHPNVGGVESHIYLLSQCLLSLGHKVIIITHRYDVQGASPTDRLTFAGVRYLPQGLKVYYLPLRTFYNQCIFPTVLGTLPIIREIYIRESVQLVHGHSAFSTLAHEALFHATCMGLHTVFTDHSLFGFADVSSILTNKVLQETLVNVDKVICVSHTSKENTVLRAFLRDPTQVYVIPNAVQAEQLTPEPERRDFNYVTIVMLSRLVYRKGLDFLVQLIPMLCQRYTNLRFLIGGDGPKRILIEEVRENMQLESRVIMLGAVKPENIREVLVQGDIFLNTSLTEAFCMAIVEAVCCGLDVVSTSVGGIPEVFPPGLMITLVQPRLDDLFKALCSQIDTTLQLRSQFLPHNKMGLLEVLREQCQAKHQWVSTAYTWPQIACRTQRVYAAAMRNPIPSVQLRLQRIMSCGPICGKVWAIVCLLQLLFFYFLQWLRPERNIGRMSIIERKIKKQS